MTCFDAYHIKQYNWGCDPNQKQQYVISRQNNMWLAIVVCFQPRGRKKIFYTRGWRLKKNTGLWWGPCPLWTGDTLMYWVLQHVSISLVSFSSIDWMKIHRNSPKSQWQKSESKSKSFTGFSPSTALSQLCDPLLCLSPPPPLHLVLSGDHWWSPPSQLVLGGILTCYSGCDQQCWKKSWLPR